MHIGARLLLSSPANDLLQRLFSSSPVSLGARPLAQLVREIQPGDLLPLVRQLSRQPEKLLQPGFQTQMSGVITRLASLPCDDPETNRQIAEILDEIYRLTPPDLPLACGWLMWLGSLGTDHALGLWADALVQQPPASVAALQWVFMPVLDRSELPAEVEQKLVGQAISDPVIAPAVLDLFNYRFRKGLSRPHVALSSAARLANLLGSMVQRMMRIEEGELPPGDSPVEISQHINNSVTMIVSLCDTLGLCHYEEAEGPLRKSMELKHRRIQTEASAALARLGIAFGQQAMVKLAAEPVARLRVLAYAEEMGLLEQIPENQQSEQARAESQLAIWLAEPTQVGMAPSKMELTDRREMFWPGFDNPVDCFLFRFEYGTQFVSTGIVGPCVHAFSVDTSWMTPSELFAAFAGWQAEHPDLFTVPASEFAASHTRLLDELFEQMELAGFENITLQVAGSLFGEWIPVATARRKGQPGTVVPDGPQPHWYPDPESGAIDPEFIWTIELGRRLLRTFNPDAGY